MPDSLYVIGVQDNGHFVNNVENISPQIPVNQQNHHKDHQRKTKYLRFKIVCLYLFQKKPRFSLLDKAVTINIVQKLEKRIGIYNLLHMGSR